jgi:hypothetical protein
MFGSEFMQPDCCEESLTLAKRYAVLQTIIICKEMKDAHTLSVFPFQGIHDNILLVNMRSSHER